MQFQILNSKGEAMPINSIDEEVAEFFGVPVHPKAYASPFSHSEEELSKLSFKDRFDIENFTQSFNWFDFIGFRIACSPKGQVNPISIYDYIEELYSFKTEGKKHIECFYSLLAYWEEKGYTLMSV